MMPVLEKVLIPQHSFVKMLSILRLDGDRHLWYDLQGLRLLHFTVKEILCRLLLFSKRMALSSVTAVFSGIFDDNTAFP